MARSDYGPGRRRKPAVSWLLDWAAGVLVGILALMLGAAIISLFVAQGSERVEVFAIMSAVVWPLGAGLGVWLCIGRPLRGLALGLGVVASMVGVAIALSPIALAPGSNLVRVAAAALALVVAPACARAAISATRSPE